jgi:lipoate-protein ligase A
MAARKARIGRTGGRRGEIAVAVVTAPTPAAIAFARDAADLAAVDTGGRPRLRLWRAQPAVAVGREQAVAREVRLTHCRAESIPVLRRPTGGGALWLDPGQICLSLAIDAAALGVTAAARLERAAGLLDAALARLGVVTRFQIGRAHV